MIAACDTFRAGAVEQLKTHCARLKVGCVAYWQHVCCCL
jgi:signal recognition particle GTPase